jgi:hypothetical protein
MMGAIMVLAAVKYAISINMLVKSTKIMLRKRSVQLVKKSL